MDKIIKALKNNKKLEIGLAELSHTDGVLHLTGAVRLSDESWETSPIKKSIITRKWVENRIKSLVRKTLKESGHSPDARLTFLKPSWGGGAERTFDFEINQVHKTKEEAKKKARKFDKITTKTVRHFVI